MRSLQLILLTGLLAITSASYAETDLTDVFLKSYIDHDIKSTKAKDLYITIIEHDTSNNREYKSSLPMWFQEETIAFDSNNIDEENYTKAINKLLSNEYLRTLDTDADRYIARVNFNISKICNLISLWSTAECIGDLKIIQEKQNRLLQEKKNLLIAKESAKKDELENKDKNLDSLITGTMGYNLGDKVNLSITTCTPFHEELLMGYKKSSEAKSLYLTRSNLGFGPDQLRNIEIKFDIANSSSSATPAFCIVKAKQKSGLFDSVAIELNEKTKIISSIYAYKNYGTVNKRDLAASYNQCNTDLEGLSDAIQNKYNSEDGKSVSGFNRSLNAFCGGGDLTKKGKFEVRLFLAYSDKALRKETYEELFALHSAKKSNAAAKFAGDI